MSDSVSQSQSDSTSLDVYSNALNEYHKLNILFLNQNGTLDKSLTTSYIIFLLKIDALSKEPFLKDLHENFLVSNPKNP